MAVKDAGVHTQRVHFLVYVHKLNLRERTGRNADIMNTIFPNVVTVVHLGLWLAAYKAIFAP